MRAQDRGPTRMNPYLNDDEHSSRLQIFFSCRNLADLDTITVTDPFLIVILNQANKPPKKILQTKVYDNNLNPDFAQTAIIDYYFQIRQKLSFQVYHYEKIPKLVGKAQATVGQVFASSFKGVKKQLINNKQLYQGDIIIRSEKINKEPQKIIQMNVSGRELPVSTCCFCFTQYPSSFFRIYRKTQKQDLLIYQSQVIESKQNPNFKRLVITERKLSKNNEQLPLQIRFYDYDYRGNHTDLGTATFTIAQLKQRQVFPIQKNKKLRGQCHISNVQRTIHYGLMDFINGGLELALMIYIDFTASNLIQTDPQSLHYNSPARMSQYEKALYQVSRILLDYDPDKLVPLYGFGAKVHMPKYNTKELTSHYFPLNGDEKDPNVFQIEGIMNAYRQALPFLEFSSPSYLKNLLASAIQEAKECKINNDRYLILLILTDGQINDKNEVIDQIIECCDLPISLIIVGIGEGDFSLMEIFNDNEMKLVDSRGVKTTRDLVQFVEFNKFKNNSIQLAKQVLLQLPDQIENYFKLVNITPQQLNHKLDPDIQQARQRSINLNPEDRHPIYIHQNQSINQFKSWRNPNDQLKRSQTHSFNNKGKNKMSRTENE